MRRGTAIKFYCLLNIFLLSTFVGSFAQAYDPCKGVDVNYITNALDYVGQKFPTQAGECIPAKNDNEAKVKCAKIVKSPGFRILNPGNPQYGLVDSGLRSSSGTHGFYLCYRGHANDKKNLCNQVKNNPALSSYNSGLKKGDVNWVEFEWKAWGRDGDCYCHHPSSSSKIGRKFTECSQAPPKQEVAKNEPVVATTKLPVSKDPSESSEPNPVLKKCIEDHEIAIKKCVDESERAKTQCSKDIAEQQDDYKDKIEFIKLFSQALVSSKAGTGSMLQCAGGSLITSAAIQLLNAAKDQCDLDMSGCETSCLEAEKTFSDLCLQFAEPSLNSETSVDTKYIKSYEAKYKDTIEVAVNKCVLEAPEKANHLRNILMAMNDSQMAAAKCACQLSTTGPAAGVPDCNSLPPVLNCIATPQIPGCIGAGNLNCTIGSAEYDSLKCQCFREPTNSRCVTAKKTLPANFPGTDLSRGIGAVDADGSVGGYHDDGDLNMDLGGFNQGQTTPQFDSAEINPESKGFLKGGAAGTASSGGGVSSGDPMAEPSGASEEDKGFLGMFNQMKSSVGNLFGKTKKAKSSAGKIGSADLNERNKSRVLRGLAGTRCQTSQVRCKNEDIFKIVERRYDINEMSFLKNP
ncbi:MAG: hypothetical protein A2622_03435 [Bdellovibrionales bacterium RIFCSPHIGHO2_01_FULL_40_29]|nr:MAG: hypothetical protein A2622_03435 [Bdellovibrionales bacterium RIFCSPHIGHO2_01_FULL_40_29]OFZ34120.1 MAG: hypothetical protein A3D17_03855 [Bdellovibrionales bacterium RIFCSPHIGHO2_02_FULL_40_15]